MRRGARLAACLLALAALARVGAGQGAPPKPHPLVEGALAARRKGDYASAADLYRRAIEAVPAPQRSALAMELGRVLEVAGKDEEAVLTYRGFKLAFAEARLHLRRGAFDKALAVYEAMGDRAGVGRMKEQLGDKAGARTAYEAAGAHAALGELLLAEGKTAEALERFAKAGDRRGQARALDRLGRKEEARAARLALLEELAKSIAKAEAEPQGAARSRQVGLLEEARAAALEELGSPREAADALARALAHAEEHERLATDGGQDLFAAAWLKLEGFPKRLAALRAKARDLAEKAKRAGR